MSGELMEKSKLVKIFSILKKYNGTFHFAEDGDNFVLSSLDDLIFYSSKDLQSNVISNYQLGPDDIEYIYSSIKESKEEEIHFKIRDEVFYCESDQKVLYQRNLNKKEPKLIIPPNETLTKEVTLSYLSNGLKFVKGFVDKKGFNAVKNLFLVQKNNELVFHSINAWCSTTFNIEFQNSIEKTVVVDIEKTNAAINLFPSGKTTKCQLGLSDNHIILIINEIFILIPLYNYDIKNVVLELFNQDFIEHCILDVPSTKQMVGHMKGIFGDSDGSFLEVSPAGQNEKGFAYISCDKYRFKIKAEFKEDEPLFMYAKYLKEIISKSSSNIIVSRKDKLLKLMSKEDGLSLISMTKRIT